MKVRFTLGVVLLSGLLVACATRPPSWLPITRVVVRTIAAVMMITAVARYVNRANCSIGLLEALLAFASTALIGLSLMGG